MEKQINEDSMQPVINPEKIIQWAGLPTACNIKIQTTGPPGEAEI